MEENLAANINYLVSHQLQEAVMVETADLYKTPVNCTSLKVPTVNPAIWAPMSSMMREQEIRFQRVLKLILAGITALGRQVEGCGMTKVQKDMLALFCNSFFEINCMRKIAIRPILHPRFAGLCRSSNVQAPDYLFGENLSKQIKEIDEEAKNYWPHETLRFWPKKGRSNEKGDFDFGAGTSRGRSMVRKYYQPAQPNVHPSVGRRRPPRPVGEVQKLYPITEESFDEPQIGGRLQMFYDEMGLYNI